MEAEEEVPAALRRVAEKVAAAFQDERGAALAFDASGVRRVDDYIEEIREHTPPEERAELIAGLGAFVGEALIAVYGGQWRRYEEDDSWRVLVMGKLWANPLGKVQKQFEWGKGDSVASFFTALPAVLREFEDRRKP